MIAITRELPSRTRREDIYALRRILVRQLQARTKGMPHAERHDCHRRFIAEWERMRDRGEWMLLHAAMQGAETGGFLGELAWAARASQGVVPAAPAIGLASRAGLDCGEARKARDHEWGFLAACREADLFTSPVAQSA